MTNAEIAALIERAVRALPGVTDVFATANAAARAAGVLRSQTPALVSVDGRSAVTRVTVSVGVAASAAAPDVAAAVGAAVRVVLADEPRASEATGVVVRVGRIGG